MIKYIFLASFSAIVVSSLASCKYSGASAAKTPFDTMQTFWAKTRIVFPNNVFVFRLAKGMDSNKVMHSHTKIVTYIDAGCSLCLTELDEWEKFLDNYKSKNNRDFQMIVVAASPDDKYLNYVLDKGNFNFNIFHDQHSDFILKNNLPSDKPYQTVLLNSKNSVELIGSPLYSKYLRNIYYRKLDSLSKIKD